VLLGSLRRRDAFVFGSADEQCFELGIEADRFDARRFNAEAWSSALAPPRYELVGLVAAFGFVGELLEQLVGDGVPDLVCP
jgi:hypothetical protein